jgi:hypothetical protein
MEIGVPYSAGCTRALQCIAHVHVLVALDAATPPLRNPWRWRLLDVAGWMLSHAIYSMVRMLLHWIGALRTNGISRRVRSHEPIRSAKGTCAVVRPMRQRRKASPATFRSRQTSAAQAQPRASSKGRRNATCSSGRVQDASPDFLLNQSVPASVGPAICMVVRTLCVRACVHACVSRLVNPSVHRSRRPRCVRPLRQAAGVC